MISFTGTGIWPLRRDGNDANRRGWAGIVGQSGELPPWQGKKHPYAPLFEPRFRDVLLIVGHLRLISPRPTHDHGPACRGPALPSPYLGQRPDPSLRERRTWSSRRSPLRGRGLGRARALLVTPAVLADPHALTASRDAPPSPAGSRKRTGKGQRRTPSRASRPADDSSAEAAVFAARSSARAAKTANRNTPTSVRHQPSRPQRVFAAFFPWHTGPVTATAWSGSLLGLRPPTAYYAGDKNVTGCSPVCGKSRTSESVIEARAGGRGDSDVRAQSHMSANFVRIARIMCETSPNSHNW